MLFDGHSQHYKHQQLKMVEVYLRSNLSRELKMVTLLDTGATAKFQNVCRD